MNMKRTTLFFPLPLIAKLKALMADTGLSMSDLVRRALDEYIERMEARK